MAIDDDRTVRLLVAETNLDEDTARTFITPSGMTKVADDAKTLGIIHDVQELSIPSGSPFFQLILPDQNPFSVPK